MRVLAVQSGPHKGKLIQVTKYNKTASGVEIELKHNLPTTAGKQLRWAQTVSENGSFFKDCGVRTYVDPFGPGGVGPPAPGTLAVCIADDSKPFYWTDPEFTGVQGPGFYDAPSENPPAKGRTWIKFVTGLTEVTGKNVHHLVAVAWGFDRLADGKVNVAGIRTPTVDEMKGHGQALKKMYPSYTFT